jgi:L-ascorbate metabolism protein UlaG (beta-lactamase superfamily)
VGVYKKARIDPGTDHWIPAVGPELRLQPSIREETEMIKEMLNKTFWLGHDGFRFAGDKIVYIDPYQIASGPAADLILVTHDHYDHCSPEDIAKVQGSNTIIVTEKDSAAKLSGDVQVVAPGGSLIAAGVPIEAVPAYNTDKAFHPKEKGWLGFIFELGGVRFYHAGDSDFIPEMSALKVDVALLPVSGTYVMDVDQAVEAALAIKPQVAVPMHYGGIVGSDEDAAAFQKALAGKIDVHIFQKA